MQRGSNENINGLIRQYLPKGTDLSVRSQETLDAMEFELNKHPRMRFDCKCLIEMTGQLMAKYHEGPSTIQGMCCTQSLHPPYLIDALKLMLL